MATRLGQLLTSSKMITEDQLKEAIGLQRREGGRLGTNLIKLGYITEEKLVSFLSKQWGVPAVTLSDYMVDSLVLKLIPYEIARKYLIVPVARVGATLTIAMADPSNVFVIDDVKFMTGFNVEVVVAGESSVINAINSYYKGKNEALVASKGPARKSELKAKDYTMSEDEYKDDDQPAVFDESPLVDVDEFDKVVGQALDDVEVIEDKDEEAVGEVERPIVKLVNGILINAVKEKASDIHVEPYENSFRIRQRVDGRMYTVMNLPVKIKSAVTSRLKIMAGLDIAERTAAAGRTD